METKNPSKSEDSPSVGFLVIIFEKVLDFTILDASNDPARLGYGNLDYAIVQDNLHEVIAVIRCGSKIQQTSPARIFTEETHSHRNITLVRRWSFNSTTYSCKTNCDPGE